MAEAPRFCSSTSALGIGQGLAFGGDQAEGGAVVLLEDAGVDLAVAGGDQQGLEALGDLAVGGDDRLEEVAAVVPLADARRSGPTSPPSPATLWQRMQETSALPVKIVSPRVGVAAGQGFAVGSQRVVRAAERLEGAGGWKRRSRGERSRAASSRSSASSGVDLRPRSRSSQGASSASAAPPGMVAEGRRRPLPLGDSTRSRGPVRTGDRLSRAEPARSRCPSTRSVGRRSVTAGHRVGKIAGR